MGRRSFGYLAIAVGSFMGLGIAMNLGEGHGAAAILTTLLFCTVAPIALGVSLLKGDRQQQLDARAERAWQSELLRLAERRGGSLTVAEVIAHADLPRDEAERRLDDLCKQGLAETRVSDGGVMVYRVEELLDEEEKRRAQGVLDA
ncbi:MAG: hypothetical protein OEZ06_30810 [Myxococcales bacterium]|nr:hypothetical protein [Myxococcales bacterium]